jgi:hypothetical protein
MKGRHLTSILTAFLLATVLVTVQGCKDDETTDPGGSGLNPPGNPRAYSASASSVGLKWTLSSSESNTSFTGYIIRVHSPGGTLVTSGTAGVGVDSAVVSGLTQGVIYTFVLKSSGSGGVESSDSVTIRWSPAGRYENESGQPAPIKVYETSSSSLFASGLVFFKISLGGPQTVSILGVDSSLVDVYVRTETNSGVTINSSHVFRPGRRITRFSTVTRDENTLNNPQALPPDTTTYNNFSVQFDSVQVTTSKIVYFKGNDGNYGRILIERNPATGRLVWGTSPEQYLSMRISYQSTAFNPYAKPIVRAIPRR